MQHLRQGILKREILNQFTSPPFVLSRAHERGQRPNPRLKSTVRRLYADAVFHVLHSRVSVWKVIE